MAGAARSHGQPPRSERQARLVVDGRAVRACEGDTGWVVSELVFAIVLAWGRSDTGEGEVTIWIGRMPGSPGRLVSGLG
jgi:hypothetical protein